MAIINPLKPRMGKRSTLAIVAIIWTISTIISCPMLVFFKTDTIDLQDGTLRVVCYAEWPDGMTNYSNQEHM